MKALSIKNLKKTYKSDKISFEALKGVNLEVEKGDFFALLGPNGAGKSTIIGILCSLVNKTSGEVKIYNTDIDKDFEGAKAYLGVVPQEFNLSVFDKVEDVLITQAGYYGVPKKLALKRSEKYLKKLGLWDKRNSQVITLSGGMKRRLMIARALVHEPKMLILDEPTAGVDIELRASMWKFIKEINKKGVTIILTTHYLEEVEELCKNVAIIDNGEIVANTSVKDLISRANSQTLIMDSKKDIKKIPKLKNSQITLIDKNTIEVKFPKTVDIGEIFHELNKQKVEIISMRNKRNRLEEFFIELTSKNKEIDNE